MLLAVTVAVLGVGGLVAYRCSIPPNPSQNSAKLPENLYAYATSEALVVMSGRTEITTYKAAFNPTSGLVWTFDGRYVVALIDLHADNRAYKTMVAIDVESKAARTFPCPRCTGIAAVGQSVVVALASVESVWQFDLASGRAVEGKTDLPKLSAGPIVLGGIPGTFLVAGSAKEGGGSGRSGVDELYLVGTDGRAKLVDTTGMGWDRVHEALAAVTSGQKGQFVVRVSTSTSYCGIIDRVFSVDAGTGRVITTDATGVTPFGFNSDAGPETEASLRFQSLWWEKNALHATVEAWKCRRGDYIPGQEIKDTVTTITKLSVWALENNRWQRAEGVLGTQIRLGNNSTLFYDIAVPTADVGKVLYLRSDTGTIAIASEVLAVAAPVIQP